VRTRDLWRQPAAASVRSFEAALNPMTALIGHPGIVAKFIRIGTPMRGDGPDHAFKSEKKWWKEWRKRLAASSLNPDISTT
jgi:hypothetical protein